MSEPTTCEGCGASLPALRHGHRKWCSERCRRHTLYTTPCKGCGKAIYDGSTNPPDECGQCKYRRIYGERNERIREMWEAGEPTQRIGEQLGMSESTVRHWVDSHRRIYGENLPLRRCRNRELWPKIQERLQAGMRQFEIAADLDEPPARIGSAIRNMRKAGWDVPPARPRRRKATT